MPRQLRRALYSLQDKHNLNKMELLRAEDVTIEELNGADVDPDGGDEEPGDSAS